MKVIRTAIVAAAMLLMCTISSWAGAWCQADAGYQYKNDDGTCLTNTWLQESGKWYFLGENGLMAVNTVMEGYQLGADGAEVTGVSTIVSQFPQVVLQTPLQPAAKGTTQSAAQNTGSSAAKATEAPKDKSITYVLNKNTKKFHKPSCSSVKDMAAKNRLDSGSAREEIVAGGYEACKRCNP